MFWLSCSARTWSALIDVVIGAGYQNQTKHALLLPRKDGRHGQCPAVLSDWVRSN
jgi:hypothetical protein